MAKKSKRGQLALNDWTKGLLMTVLAAVLTALQQAAVNWQDLSQINWGLIQSVAIGAGVTYVLKNLGTNSEDKFLKKDPEKPLV